MKRLWMAALVLAGAGMPVQAQTPGVISDVRCFLVSTMMASSMDPATQNAGMTSTMYWMGHLDAQTQGMDLETIMLAESEKLQGTDMIQAELQRCGNALAARGRAIVELGEAIGKAQAAKEATAP